MTDDRPMTAVQEETLKTLAHVAYELDAFDPNLTHTEADERIAMLTAKLKRPFWPPHTLCLRPATGRIARSLWASEWEHRNGDPRCSVRPDFFTGVPRGSGPSHTERSPGVGVPAAGRPTSRCASLLRNDGGPARTIKGRPSG